MRADKFVDNKSGLAAFTVLGCAPWELIDHQEEELARATDTLQKKGTARGYKLDVTDIPAIARNALKEAHYTYAVPRYMDQRTCERLIGKMLA